jgi:predicted DsbA family dithiol-disulfide isomerase
MYFSEGGDPSDHRVLADSAERAGLDRAEAEAVLASTDFADQVRRREQENWADGISAVPTLIVDGRYLIVGAQPAEALERAFLSIAAEPQTVEPSHQR